MRDGDDALGAGDGHAGPATAHRKVPVRRGVLRREDGEELYRDIAALLSESPEALRARGFEIVETEEACDVIVKVQVGSWEFNDAGFGGRGTRDDMELSVALVDRRRKRVLGRSNISLRSDFRIIGKYVDGL